MAEFQVVIKQFHRLCGEHPDCIGCPMIDFDKRCKNVSFSCSTIADERAEEFEPFIMKWANEHPEPKYPSRQQWWSARFPDGESNGAPCWEYFLPKSEYQHRLCAGVRCDECRCTPIPADIAKKLGIAPLEG